jgi:sirohydrochlorin ferrochelatase
MRALVLIAHGSRRTQSNCDIEALANLLSAHPDLAFDITRYAFLENAVPSILQVIDQCVDDGASEIVVLPYFLSPGNHVMRDIPERIETKRKEYLHVQFEVLEYFGKSAAVVDWLVSHVNDGP